MAMGRWYNRVEEGRSMSDGDGGCEKEHSEQGRPRALWLVVPYRARAHSQTYAYGAYIERI
jgi:hypothetical protein